MRLAEQIAHWLGRVELVLAGVDDSLRDGQDALFDGDFMRARARAHAILSRLPGSPLGLALLADACEMGSLDAELELALEELAPKVASRAEVWVRLAHVRRRTGAPAEGVRDAFLRALAVAEPGGAPRREALVALAEIDLAAGDAARAELWLERNVGDPGAAHRRAFAEARRRQGDPEGALRHLDAAGDDPTDGALSLTRGLALAQLGKRECFAPLLRAFVLDSPGASEALSSALAFVPSTEDERGKIRLVVESRGELGEARWRAAFARSEGRKNEATLALADAVRGGERSALRPLLDAALDDENDEALALALSQKPTTVGEEPTILDARRLEFARSATDVSLALDALSAIAASSVLPWAEKRVEALARRWVPDGGAQADWSLVLARLELHARRAEDLDAVAAIYALSGARTRPVRVAIVGEFNAGKSTFINALIGADVAPTGVLPTTATLHHLRYAPDRFARIVFVPGAGSEALPERIVQPDDLRATLKSLDVATIQRVDILLPLDALTRIEIIDTPGFNAPDARHTAAARTAFDEADFALWLVDAGQAMKQTERVVLEEARASRLPVQVLVNKIDRLDETERAKVMTLVQEGLATMGLVSWREPLGLSAKLALEAKLGKGDTTTLARSGWEAVDALITEHVVARSAELKERALRRRARAIVLRVLSKTDELARREEEVERDREARAHALTQAAFALERDVDARASDLDAAIEPSVAALARDLAVLVGGSGFQNSKGDSDGDVAKDRYREGRSLAHLAPAIARALLRWAPPSSALHEADLLPLARMLVPGFAAGGRSPSDAASPSSTSCPCF